MMVWPNSMKLIVYHNCYLVCNRIYQVCNCIFISFHARLHTQCLSFAQQMNIFGHSKKIIAHLMLRLHNITSVFQVCTPNVWFAKFAHPMFQSILTRISLGKLTADLARMCSRIANSSCLFFSKTWRRETKEMDQAILTEHCL